MGGPDFIKRTRLLFKLGVKTACSLSVGHCWDSEDSSGRAREVPGAISNLCTEKLCGSAHDSQVLQDTLTQGNLSPLEQ